MKRHKEGSLAWFQHARERCVDHLRAITSIRSADTSISTILARWTTEDVAILASLHSATVIAYAQPFTPARTKVGKVSYGESALKKAPGFDRDLHSHLLTLRNQLIAHSDYDFFPSTMYLQTVGDEMLPVAMGVNVKSMFGIEARSLAERYQVHFRSCMKSIEETLNQELREIARQARNYPTEFNASHNVPISTSEANLATEFLDFPGPTGPSSHVSEPSFPEGLRGYRYVTLQHLLALIGSGKHTIHDHGIQKEVTFEVD